jgi:hypothetical protein
MKGNTRQAFEWFKDVQANFNSDKKEYFNLLNLNPNLEWNPEIGSLFSNCLVSDFLANGKVFLVESELMIDLMDSYAPIKNTLWTLDEEFLNIYKLPFDIFTLVFDTPIPFPLYSDAPEDFDNIIAINFARISDKANSFADSLSQKIAGTTFEKTDTTRFENLKNKALSEQELRHQIRDAVCSKEEIEMNENYICSECGSFMHLKSTYGYLNCLEKIRIILFLQCPKCGGIETRNVDQYLRND